MFFILLFLKIKLYIKKEKKVYNPFLKFLFLFFKNFQIKSNYILYFVKYQIKYYIILQNSPKKLFKNIPNQNKITILLSNFIRTKSIEFPIINLQKISQFKAKTLHFHFIIIL